MTAVIEPVEVQLSGLRLSGLLASPGELRSDAKRSASRGLIVALHGGGYCAGYWDCPADDASLLALGTRLGFQVLALDRPGYGLSSTFNMGLADQVGMLFDAIDSWSAVSGFAGRVFVIGHSMGGILALMMAAHERAPRLSGIDVLGIPFGFASSGGEVVQAFPTDQTHVPMLADDLHQPLLFGPAGTFSAAALEYDRAMVRPMPVAEYQDAMKMPDKWSTILPSIRIPVQFNAAEFEAMQLTGQPALDRARTLLRNSALCAVHLQLAAGHNASSHRIARAYHLRAIAFFEECMARA